MIKGLNANYSKKHYEVINDEYIVLISTGKIIDVKKR